VDAPFSASQSVATSSGDWLAYVSPALGGRNDVWLARGDKQGDRGPWFTGLTAPGRIELQYIEVVDGGRILLETVERECEGCYLDDEDRPTSGKPVETLLDPDALAADGDKDGWTDLVEARLGTDPARKDTDGDGVADAKDRAPLASSKHKPSASEEVLLAAAHALLAFTRADEPLVVVGPDETRLAYEGHGSVVVHASSDEARALLKRVGLPGPPMLAFGCPVDGDGDPVAGCPSDGPLGFVVMDAAAGRASVGITLYRSESDAALYGVELERISSTWVVTRFALVGFM
jgi:hypothetical protein